MPGRKKALSKPAFGPANKPKETVAEARQRRQKLGLVPKTHKEKKGKMTNTGKTHNGKPIYKGRNGGYFVFGSKGKIYIPAKNHYRYGLDGTAAWLHAPPSPTF